jgi:tRNA(fMet)-specific endonuclease VapC
MKYMLDTNMCIFIMKQRENVVKRFKEVHGEGVCISSITLAELIYGVEKSDAVAKNRAMLFAFSTRVEILPFDSFVTETYGKIRADLERKGTRIGELDTLIASHAKALGLILVTNNTREFNRVTGLLIEDWLQETYV